jgi:flavoprotein
MSRHVLQCDNCVIYCPQDAVKRRDQACGAMSVGASVASCHICAEVLRLHQHGAGRRSTITLKLANSDSDVRAEGEVANKRRSSNSWSTRLDPIDTY